MPEACGSLELPCFLSCPSVEACFGQVSVEASDVVVASRTWSGLAWSAPRSGAWSVARHRDPPSSDAMAPGQNNALLDNTLSSFLCRGPRIPDEPWLDRHVRSWRYCQTWVLLKEGAPWGTKILRQSSKRWDSWTALDTRCMPARAIYLHWQLYSDRTWRRSDGLPSGGSSVCGGPGTQ